MTDTTSTAVPTTPTTARSTTAISSTIPDSHFTADGAVIHDDASPAAVHAITPSFATDTAASCFDNTIAITTPRISTCTFTTATTTATHCFTAVATTGSAIAADDAVIPAAVSAVTSISVADEASADVSIVGTTAQFTRRLLCHSKHQGQEELHGMIYNNLLTKSATPIDKYSTDNIPNKVDGLIYRNLHSKAIISASTSLSASVSSVSMGKSLNITATSMSGSRMRLGNDRLQSRSTTTTTSDSVCSPKDNILKPVDTTSKCITSATKFAHVPTVSNGKILTNVDGLQYCNLKSKSLNESLLSKCNDPNNVEGNMYSNLKSEPIHGSDKSAHISPLSKAKCLKNVNGLLYDNMDSKFIPPSAEPSPCPNDRCLKIVDSLVYENSIHSKSTDTVTDSIESVTSGVKGKRFCNIDGLLYDNASVTCIGTTPTKTYPAGPSPTIPSYNGPSHIGAAHISSSHVNPSPNTPSQISSSRKGFALPLHLHISSSSAHSCSMSRASTPLPATSGYLPNADPVYDHPEPTDSPIYDIADPPPSPLYAQVGPPSSPISQNTQYVEQATEISFNGKIGTVRKRNLKRWLLVISIFTIAIVIGSTLYVYLPRIGEYHM